MTNKAVVSSEDIVTKGPCAMVAYARRTNGNKPAEDYIENLEQTDHAKLTKLFRTMANIGKINNTDRFEKLGGQSGKIYEFKVYPRVRVLCFQRGNTWLLTHGFPKQTRQTPRIQIERAEAIMKEHILLLDE